MIADASPPGARYGRARFGSRRRSTMKEAIINTYVTGAPKTEIWTMFGMAVSGSMRLYANTIAQPRAAGRTSAMNGVRRPPVIERMRGRYPARESEKVIREYAKMIEWKLAIRPVSPTTVIPQKNQSFPADSA